MSVKAYLIFSSTFLIIVQLLSLTLPPFGILLGTPFVLPVLIWLTGNNLRAHRKEEMMLVMLLIFSQISKTIDWYYAPGTHDMQGAGWMFLMTIVSSLLMFCLGIISIKRMRDHSRKTFFLPIILCFALLIIPTIYHNFLNKYFNSHLGRTNKNIWEYVHDYNNK